MRITLSLFFFVYLLAVAAAEITNEVDVVALGSCGNGITSDGWQLNSLTNYSDGYSSALRFYKNESYAVSPQYGQRIIRIEAELISSSQSGRHLRVVPMVREEEQANLVHTFEYSSTKNVFSSQSAEWRTQDLIRQFRLDLDDGGGTTAWGIRRLLVITWDPPAGTAVHML